MNALLVLVSIKTCPCLGLNLVHDLVLVGVILESQKEMDELRQKY